jgi:hypothetical protein
MLAAPVRPFQKELIAFSDDKVPDFYFTFITPLQPTLPTSSLNH